MTVITKDLENKVKTLEKEKIISASQHEQKVKQLNTELRQTNQQLEAIKKAKTTLANELENYKTVIS